MSDDPEQLPEAVVPAAPQRRGQTKRIIILILFVLAAQAAFIILLGEKKAPAIRPVKDAPHFQLTDNDSGLMALNDPTLFALPHTHDFAANVWLGPVVVAAPSFAWTETPRWLPLNLADLGLNLRLFLDTNTLTIDQPGYKPEPALAQPTPSLAPQLAAQTTMQIHGDLANRPLMQQPSLSSLTNDELVAHTRVQVLVNAAGNVISAVSLPTGSMVVLPENPKEKGDSDARALALVRDLRFAAADSPATFGQITFNWHTVVIPDTTPAAP